MYKHSVLLNVRLSVVTEHSLSAEELEELLHSLDYEFSSDYGIVSTTIEENYTSFSNKAIK